MSSAFGACWRAAKIWPSGVSGGNSGASGGDTAGGADTSVRRILAAPGGGGGGRSSLEDESAAMTTLSAPWLRTLPGFGAFAMSDAMRGFGSTYGAIDALGFMTRSMGA